jgi:hypothetical protein
MGNVKDRYIHYEKAGDQFTGRCCTGISSLTKEFALSPVHFDFTDVGEAGTRAVQVIIEEKFLEQHVVEPNIFELIGHLFAAVCFHHSFLDDSLPDTDRLRASPIFNAAGTFAHRECATTSFPWASTNFTPPMSGIPPHTMLLAEVERLKTELRKQADTIVSAMTNELDRRSVGGSVFETKELLTEVKRLLQDRQAIPPAGPPPEDVGNDDPNFEFEFHDDIGVETDRTTTVVVRPAVRQKKAFTYYVSKNGRFRLLPENFQFPELTLATLVTAWHCGNSSAGIPPYKMLKTCDVREVKSGTVKLSCMRKLMAEVSRAAIHVGREQLLRKNMTEQDAIRLHNAVKHMFKMPAKGKRSRRHATLSWKSYYNMMLKRNWQLFGEQYDAVTHCTKKRKRRRSRADDFEEAVPVQPKKKRQPPREPISRNRHNNTGSQNNAIVAGTRPNGVSFSNAFELPSLDQQRQMQSERDKIKKARPYECCLAEECSHATISGRHKCHRKQCPFKIHHLCAIRKKLYDRNNEQVCYCSSMCMPDR